MRTAGNCSVQERPNGVLSGSSDLGRRMALNAIPLAYGTTLATLPNTLLLTSALWCQSEHLPSEYEPGYLVNPIRWRARSELFDRDFPIESGEIRTSRSQGWCFLLSITLLMSSFAMFHNFDRKFLPHLNLSRNSCILSLLLLQLGPKRFRSHIGSQTHNRDRSPIRSWKTGIRIAAHRLLSSITANFCKLFVPKKGLPLGAF